MRLRKAAWRSGFRQNSLVESFTTLRIPVVLVPELDGSELLVRAQAWPAPGIPRGQKIRAMFVKLPISHPCQLLFVAPAQCGCGNEQGKQAEGDSIEQLFPLPRGALFSSSITSPYSNRSGEGT